jgi:hypothetical protein
MRAVMLAAVAVVALAAGCKKDTTGKLEISTEEIVVVHDPTLRTSMVGGQMDPREIEIRQKLNELEPDPNVRAERERMGAQGYDVGDAPAVSSSYVLVDAENRSVHDAYVTLDGTLSGGEQKAELKAESLFVPAGGIRTFLLLDDELKPREWATGVNVKVVGALIAKFPPSMAISDENVFTDGDHVVAAATVTSTVKAYLRGIVHCAFHDAAQKPIGRGHAILELEGGATSNVRFVGPRGSKTATIFAGDATY